jgi:hypothetical protein
MPHELSQIEADSLLATEKMRSTTNALHWPMLGGKLSVPLQSPDGREEFILDISRGTIKLSKLTLQNRARETVILVRLDIDGPPHRNPDDTEVSCPHLHIFREGFADKWAFPVPTESFTDLSNKEITLADFSRYCNVTQALDLGQVLF